MRRLFTLLLVVSIASFGQGQEANTKLARIEELGRIGGEESIRELRSMFDDQESAVRRRAAEVWLRIGPPFYASRLDAVMGELGKWASPRKLQDLKLQLDRDYAVLKTPEFGMREWLPKVVDVVGNPDPHAVRVVIDEIEKSLKDNDKPPLKDEPEEICTMGGGSPERAALNYVVEKRPEVGLQLLQERKTPYKAAMISALARCSYKPASTAVTPYLKSSNITFRMEAVAAVGVMSPTGAEIVAPFLRDSSQLVRRAACLVLCGQVPAVAIPDLLAMESPPTNNFYDDARNTLDSSKDPSIGSYYLSRLRQSAVGDEVGWINRLASHPARAAILDLVRFMHSKNAEVACSAVKALAAIEGLDVDSILIDAFHQIRVSEARVAAIESLASRKSDASRSAVITALGDKDVNVVVEALRQTGRNRWPEARAKVVELRGSRNPQIWEEAITTLKWLDDVGEDLPPKV